jgi:hypothetical protein
MLLVSAELQSLFEQPVSRWLIGFPLSGERLTLLTLVVAVDSHLSIV